MGGLKERSWGVEERRNEVRRDRKNEATLRIILTDVKELEDT